VIRAICVAILLASLTTLTGCAAGVPPAVLAIGSAVSAIGGAAVVVTNEDTALINQYLAIKNAKVCPLPVPMHQVQQ
jgi:hypothetical protein